MADEIKLNAEQFNTINRNLISIMDSLETFENKYVELELRKQNLEVFKVGYQLNKNFMIDNFLKANNPMIRDNQPLEFAKVLVENYPESDDTTNSNSNINNEKFDVLIKEIANSSKDDRNSFNMLVNTLKDTNTKEELKELKSLTIATNDLLVKQVNSQNQANAISLIFSISMFACLAIGFCVKTFSKMF